MSVYAKDTAKQKKVMKPIEALKNRVLRLKALKNRVLRLKAYGTNSVE